MNETWIAELVPCVMEILADFFDYWQTRTWGRTWASEWGSKQELWRIVVSIGCDLLSAGKKWEQTPFIELPNKPPWHSIQTSQLASKLLNDWKCHSTFNKPLIFGASLSGREGGLEWNKSELAFPIKLWFVDQVFASQPANQFVFLFEQQTQTTSSFLPQLT